MSLLRNPTALATAILVTLLCGSALPAQALEVDARIDPVRSDVANGLAVNPGGNAIGWLRAGDRLAVEVVVRNPEAEAMTVLTASLVFDAADLRFDGGRFEAALVESNGNALHPASPYPFLKPASPYQTQEGTEEWVQILRHANAAGAQGREPRTAAVVEFVVERDLGDQPLAFAVLFTEGDFVETRDGGAPLHPIVLDRALLNTRPPIPVPDRDADRVPDEVDNCPLTPNGPAQSSSQIDTDRDGYGNACDCDFDQDGGVSGRDLVDLYEHFNSDSSLYDVDGDGSVGGIDATRCLARFGQPVGD